nr:30S ribosomal protein S6 [Acidimicrobiia bacterium]
MPWRCRPGPWIWGRTRRSRSRDLWVGKPDPVTLTGTPASAFRAVGVAVPLLHHRRWGLPQRMSTGGDTLRVYEVMTIHRPELAESDVQAKVKEVETFLTSRGAEIQNTDLWGKRRFAYEIDHINEGFYSVVKFAAGTEAIDDLDRVLSLSDDVVRHKIVRVD